MLGSQDQIYHCRIPSSLMVLSGQGEVIVIVTALRLLQMVSPCCLCPQRSPLGRVPCLPRQCGEDCGADCGEACSVCRAGEIAGVGAAVASSRHRLALEPASSRPGAVVLPVPASA